jgi:CRISPR/Cas system-associated exonuclease Cas4 (RecB family)
MEMKAFLQELAEELFVQHGHDMQHLTVVFPNRRAGLFFRKYLSQLIDRPIWAPEILSIEDCMKGLTNLQPADRLTLVFELYEEYQKLSPVEESFDRFYYWGEMLLKDFDDIDKYLISARHLLASLKDEKDIEEMFDFLTEEQLELIRTFWSSFKVNVTEQKADFMRVWEILYPVYKSFNKRLREKKIGYEGMIFREVCRLIDKDELNTDRYQNLILAGFNALTKAEEKIFSWFKQKCGAKLYWDTDAFYMEDKKQEAGHYLRKYRQGETFGDTFPKKLPNAFADKNARNIEIFGVPLEVGQAKQLGEKLRELIRQKGKDFDPENTVIVLPDEQNLFPVLHAIPEEIKVLNVTMGYPLKNTPLYSLLEHLLDLQQNLQSKNGKLRFHYRHVLALLRHPYLRFYNLEKATELLGKIENYNIVFVEEEMLNSGGKLYDAIFKEVSEVSGIFDYLLNILVLINEAIREEDNAAQVMEQEYIYHFYTQLRRLKENVESLDVELNRQTFVKLFRQIIQTLRLPFTGEPLKGLQIMGVLETRNLDFENVFILSMNEGTFPAQSGGHSFIPFNLRKAYSLPTMDQSDAVYAYSFYRLLQRAKNVYLFYNTEEGQNSSGEKSRFLHQLIYESGFKLNEQVLSNPVQNTTSQAVSIQKDAAVMEALSRYLSTQKEKPARLTPSALSSYLDCRLRFYFRYVARLYEPNQVQEDIDAMAFGNLLHRTMEFLYKDFIEKENRRTVEKSDFTRLQPMLEKAVIQAFSEHYALKEGEEPAFKGHDIIARDIILKFAKRILSEDEKYAPFEIVGLEADAGEGYALDMPIQPNGKKLSVGLKGIIDRIDRKDGQVRVIDYKTGRDDKTFVDIPSLFDREHDKRNKAAMQVMFYGLLYKNRFPQDQDQVMAGLFNAKELFGGKFDIRLVHSEGPRQKTPVDDITPFIDEYQKELTTLLEEIYNTEVPFDQTEDRKKCGYCPYAGICHR